MGNYEPGPIKSKTYVYMAVGKTEDGKTNWERKGEPTVKDTGFTKFGDLKKDNYEKTKDKDNVFTNYKKPQIESVTKTASNGKKKYVTFFGRDKKGK